MRTMTEHTQAGAGGSIRFSHREKVPGGRTRGEGKTAALAAVIAGAGLVLLLGATPAFAAEGVGGEVDPLVYRLAVFVLAIFVGYYVVWSVTPSLHTPLMSVTNAISSVIVVGALLSAGIDASAGESSGTARVFGFLALTLASVNIFGGFLVTERMLSMFKKKG